MWSVALLMDDADTTNSSSPKASVGPHCSVNLFLLKSDLMIITQILCFSFFRVRDSKTCNLKFHDSEISPSCDIQGLFSVQGEPEGGPLYFEGDELGGWLYFSIPRVFLKKEK